jgi:DNA-binding phage protein
MRNEMKNLDRASISHDEVMARELRDDPELAAEYLQAAMDDTAEPAVLLLALRHVAAAHGMPE